MDRAGARTSEKKAHREKTGGEGLGRGVYRRIEIPLPENLKNRKIRGAIVGKGQSAFGSQAGISRGIRSILRHLIAVTPVAMPVIIDKSAKFATSECGYTGVIWGKLETLCMRFTRE
jgi:hypothetical protein